MKDPLTIMVRLVKQDRLAFSHGFEFSDAAQPDKSWAAAENEFDMRKKRRTSLCHYGVGKFHRDKTLLDTF